MSQNPTIEHLFLEVACTELSHSDELLVELVGVFRDNYRPYFINDDVVRNRIWQFFRQDAHEEALHKLLRIGMGFRFALIEHGLESTFDRAINEYINDPAEVLKATTDTDFYEKSSTPLTGMPKWLAALLFFSMRYPSLVTSINTALGPTPPEA